ncbi:MAG: T9SS type A sorting domain-containing protein [Candidatus Marinimicrobia bacterium]|nr:T9SS type A sorting domain-containing protein [Candidatus Neomarinimicrobiota bacterium]
MDENNETLVISLSSPGNATLGSIASHTYSILDNDDLTPPAAPTSLAATPGDGQITLTWSPNTEADLSHYRVYQGAGANFDTTGALAAQVDKSASSALISGLSNGTTYFYRITAVDSAGNVSGTSAEVSEMPAASDSQGPIIADLPSSLNASVGNPITITATITDTSPIQSVTLYYAGGGSSSYSQVSMSDQGGDTYSGTIPFSDVTFMGLAYFIVAQDNLGNPSTSDTASIPVRFPAEALTSSSAFPGGFPKDVWRLISLPTDLDDFSVANTIQDDLGEPPSNTTWKLFRYVGPGSNDYQEATRFVLGESYFLKQVVGDGILFVMGSGGQTVDLTGFALTLQPRRWHFVSSPYAFPVAVDANQSTFIGPYTYGAFGSGGQEGWSLNQVQTTFKPWGGYIIYNNTGSTQVLEIIPPGLAKAVLPKAMEEPVPGWLLHLTATGQRYFDAGNVVGRLAGALDGLDSRDHPEPPVPEGYISITMDRPEWELPRTADIRSLETIDGSWDLALDTRDEPGPITLAYQLEGEPPPAVALVDLPARKVYRLSAGERPAPITAYNEHFSYRLKVIAGSESYVSSTTNEVLDALPTDFALAQNYPNPFNPNTTIEYALPKPARISLRVYDLLGREVAILVNRWQDMGRFNVVWEGVDKSGRPVVSGIYFTVFQAERVIRTRKMLLLK